MNIASPSHQHPNKPSPHVPNMLCTDKLNLYQIICIFIYIFADDILNTGCIIEYEIQLQYQHCCLNFPTLNKRKLKNRLNIFLQRFHKYT